MWRMQFQVFYNSNKPFLCEELGIRGAVPQLSFDSLNDLLKYLTGSLPPKLTFSNYIEAVKTDGKAIEKLLAESRTLNEWVVSSKVAHMLDLIQKPPSRVKRHPKKK